MILLLPSESDKDKILKLIWLKTVSPPMKLQFNWWRNKSNWRLSWLSRKLRVEALYWQVKTSWKTLETAKLPDQEVMTRPPGPVETVTTWWQELTQTLRLNRLDRESTLDKLTNCGGDPTEDNENDLDMTKLMKAIENVPNLFPKRVQTHKLR